jgi:uncharacterized protein
MILGARSMAELNSEPTMEEILSSIKKIIAEDSGKSAATVAARRSIDKEPSRDHLVSIPISNIVPEVRIDTDPPKPDSPAIRLEPPTSDNEDVLELTEMAAEESTVAPLTLVTDTKVPDTKAEVPAAAMVSVDATAATRSAFESLSALIVKPEVHGGDTLEGLVREMLRPMLKDWLDARLPEMVEALVAKEIARISGR